MGVVTWGTARIPGSYKVQPFMRPQQAPPVRTNPETTRVDRIGTRQLKITTLDGGLGVRHGSEASKDIQRIKSSEGNWSHIFGNLTLPPVLTAQANLVALDISGYRDANRAIHALNTTMGQSKQRLHLFVGTKHLRTTSDSNPALADSSMSLTDKVTGVFEGKFNSARGLAICTDGTTNDISVCTDPTASPPTLATLIALSGGDWPGGGWFMPNLGPGYNFFYGKIGGTSGLWFLETDEALATAPRPLVLDETKDVEGSIASVTASAVDLSLVGVDNTVGTVFLEGTGGSWNSNNNAFSAASLTSGRVYFGNGNFSAIPIGARILGYSIVVAHQEEAGTNDIFPIEVVVRAGGQVSVSFADGAELGTSGTDTYGGNSITGGIDLVGNDLVELIVQLRYGTNAAPGAAGDASGSDVDVTVTYRELGTQASIPLGGKVIGVDPLNANVVYIRAPEFQDDTTGINVPRILWKVTCMYDEASARPTCKIEKVATTLSNVEAACFAMGGIIVAGDSSSGTGKACKRITPDGEVFDMLFGLGQGYTENWGIVGLQGADKVFVADVVLEDATVVQSWVCVDGKWSPISKRQTITSLPLAYAEAWPVDLNQRYRYRIYPQTTNLSVNYQFQPRNLLLDPLVSNTSIVKENGPLATVLPALDALGPEEALKVLLTAWFLGRDVSSTNTVRLRYSTDDGSSFTTWTTFTSFGSKSALSTPVLERTTVFELALDHSAGGTGTPNGLTFLIEGYSTWKALRGWRVFFNPEDEAFKAVYRPAGVEKLWDTLATLQEAGPAQLFKGGNGISKLAAWTDFHSSYLPGADVTHDAQPLMDEEEHYLQFEEVTQ